MKIVCDNCATKYSIADEKVRGKVFKIRCKKCSYIIVVRGGDGAAAAAPAGDAGGADAGFPGDDAAARPASAGVGTGEAVWHLVVDREQVGPLTREEVRAKFGAGEIDVETYAWREGFGDWLRLGSIEDFRDLGGGAAAPAAEPTTKRTDSADLFANAAAGDEPAAGEAGGDLFGGSNSPSAPTGETPMPAPGGFPAGSGAGLFSAPQPMAAAAAAPRQRASTAPGYAAPAGGGDALAAAPADAKSKMTGQRNENSVLFSLNNLQALASGGGGGSGGASASKSSSSSASSSSPSLGDGQRPGFASSQTEGSGLIDIRAMAASTLSAPSSSVGKGADDGPSFASAPMFSPMAAPILMPAPASGPPKWLWPVLGVALAAVIGIVVLGVVMLTRKPDLPAVAVAPVAPPPTAVPIAAPVAPPTAPVAAPPTAPVAAPAADDGDKKHHGGKGKHDKKDNAAATPGAPTPAAPTAPAVTPKKAGGKRDELDDLLNNAAPDRPAPKRSAPAESAAPAGKERLEKGDIVAGMSKVKGRVAGCYDQYKVPGLANVSVTISPSGRVSSANVSGSFSGTPTGECVEKAVKSASFPAAKEGQTITYPFMLR